jgi:hypothetical protein
VGAVVRMIGLMAVYWFLKVQEDRLAGRESA